MLFSLPAALVLSLACSATGPDSVIAELLPRPREVQLEEGTYAFEPGKLKIAIQGGSLEQRQRLVDLLIERSDDLPSDRRLDPGHVVATSDPSPQYRLSACLEGTGPALPDWSPEPARAEGYQLVVSKAGIAVGAAGERGLFYGIQTLAQLLNHMALKGEAGLPCLTIRDWPALGMRGYSEDYGRNQLPTIEDHKRSIRFLAQYKMNTYLWFIEPDHFVYKFDPTIGQDYDRFTFDEIRELVAYAKRYHVEIIPTVELLGHMEMLLSHPKYKALAEVEGGGDLCATSEESFELVRKLVGEIAPAFESKYFHCGLDESFQVGKGRSAQAVKDKGIERVFADYYTRMDELVKSHGKTMMMYADIVLAHPAMIDLLPKDIVMMFWDYTPRDRYEGLDKLSRAGFPLTTLSGMWDWVSLYPVYAVGVRNMDRLAAQSSELKVMGHFVSDWGDPVRTAAGTNLSELATFGVAYCAAVSWNPQPIPIAEFSRAFVAQFYGLDSSAPADAISGLAVCQGERVAHVRRFFQIDPVETARQLATVDEKEEAFWRGVKAASDDAAKVLAAAKPGRNGDYFASVELSARMMQFTADLALLCRSLGLKLRAGDFNAEEYAKAFDVLAARQQMLWKSFQRTYLATNRPMNLKFIEVDWDWMHKRLLDAAAQLRAGKIAPAKQ